MTSISRSDTPALTRLVRGTGPGVLLAHGGGGGAEANFGPLLDGLAAEYTVVGPDYPGAGRTPRSTRPLDIDVLADQLVAAAVEEGLDTFAVVGYSMGAPLAVRAARRHPDRVRALVLTAGFAVAGPRLRHAVRLWKGLLEHGDEALLGSFLTIIAGGVPYLDGLSGEQIDGIAAHTARTVPSGTPEHVDLAGRMDVRADLPHIAVPTLVISTTEDLLATPASQRELAEGIPAARLVDIDTGHLPFVEQPEQWSKLIHGFLGEVHRR
ncbi:MULTISPECIES: alpha/beta fold hydrolase [Actinoalloteichus]|uniref:Hydrolase or acyltransferase of alpha/beta superfamily n=1 Tax=Actinoalloteichus fjordicus TaxID=1612552 RepID=A0AAC9PVM0_9PSEU|nr:MULTISPECIES: alpha/beta hydrolase [Actinoalloteichus]APU18006.1 putative hydrolase or acyltransferase of alpha/beta superfamily [Actinoalloteichus fjordicus]APU24085.1 putative hydrolase or acyltransferase of alpha/beta superfamily [Actinoalloteichus sp. GBA129-24]